MHFSEQERQVSSELRSHIDELHLEASKKNMHLKIESLLTGSTIDLNENSPIIVLQRNCEAARDRVRSLVDIQSFLRSVGWALQFENVIDLATLASGILEAPKERLHEDEVRAFMRKMELPERDFIVLRTHRKQVINETSTKIREELEAENSQWEKARRIQQGVRKLLPFKGKLLTTQIFPMCSGEVRLTAGDSIRKFGRNFNLWITYDCPKADFLNMRQSLIDASWKIDRPQYTEEYHEIEKAIEFSVDETMKAAKEKLISELAPFRAQSNLRETRQSAHQ
jgi:hypothetical protein